MKALDLAGTRVTGKGMKTLAGCPELNSLNLSGTKVTGEHLQELKDCKKLKKLFLRGSPAAKGDDVSKLRKSLPGCIISQ